MEVLKTLETGSVNMCITSPPYYGLRDYGVEGQLGLEETPQEYINKLCDVFDEVKRVLREDGTCWVNLSDSYQNTLNNNSINISEKDRTWLAALLDGEGSFQIHKQERTNTIPSYQADISVGMIDKEMVEYAYLITGLGSLNLQNRGVWDWGVRGQEAGLLANIVYPYLKIKNKQAKALIELCKSTKCRDKNIDYRQNLRDYVKSLNKRQKVDMYLPEPKMINFTSINRKSLIGIPAMFQLEMVHRGWVLRNVLIWHKPSCMPSSVQDRYTIDFEYFFFFSKNTKYYFKQQLEPYKTKNIEVPIGGNKHKGKRNTDKYFSSYSSVIPKINDGGRIKRSVWSIPTASCKEAHFAVYPEKLIESPIDAGCPLEICDKCNKPKKFILEVIDKVEVEEYNGQAQKDYSSAGAQNPSDTKRRILESMSEIKRTISVPDCDCGVGFHSGVVLDCFFGAGTTGVVALKQNKKYLGIELNPEYIEIAKRRLDKITPSLF